MFNADCGLIQKILRTTMRLNIQCKIKTHKNGGSHYKIKVGFKMVDFRNFSNMVQRAILNKVSPLFKCFVRSVVQQSQPLQCLRGPNLNSTLFQRKLVSLQKYQSQIFNFGSKRFSKQLLCTVEKVITIIYIIKQSPI